MKTNASFLRHLAAVATLLLPAATLPSFAQTTATTDPVGFITLTIKGTGGTQASAISFLGLGITPPVEYQGIADSVNGTTITSNNTAWTDNQFASTPAPGYFLEVTSGSNAGLMSLVASCNAAAKTLTVADDLTALGVANGATFKLRKNWSLGSLFGSTNSAGLGGGSSSTADLVLLWNPTLNSGTGGYDQFFYSTGGFAGVGWRKVGGGSTDQQYAAILLDDGLVVKRLQSADVSVAVSGAVKLGPTESTILVGPNFIGNVYAGGVMTLGNTDATAVPPKYSSGLYTGISTTGLVAGTSGTADLVLIWNQTLNSGAGGYDQYFYSSGGFAGIGWRNVGGGSTDQKDTIIATGTSVLIKRNSGGSFTWVAPQPFPNP